MLSNPLCGGVYVVLVVKLFAAALQAVDGSVSHPAMEEVWLLNLCLRDVKAAAGPRQQEQSANLWLDLLHFIFNNSIVPTGRFHHPAGTACPTPEVRPSLLLSCVPFLPGSCQHCPVQIASGPRVAVAAVAHTCAYISYCIAQTKSYTAWHTDLL